MSFVADIDNQIADLFDRRYAKDQLRMYFITDIANMIIEFNDLCYEDVKKIKRIVTTDTIKRILLSSSAKHNNNDQRYYYKLCFYQGDTYFGADIHNSICRASSDAEAVLKFDQYVETNSSVGISIISNSLETILDDLLSFDMDVVTLEGIAILVVGDLLTINDTLYINRLDVF